jgi:hypothetical protein
MQPLTKRVFAEAEIDPLPVYRSKTPLQQAVQLLKRHRDVMFAQDPDLKPVSIILTTIAGGAYEHGEDLQVSMQRILRAFEAVRQSDTDEILNPVNPLENFADRWTRPDCVQLELKRHFHEWIGQARRDFAQILVATQAQVLVEVAEDAFQIRVLKDAFDTFVAFSAPTVPRRVTLESEPARPWRERG